MEDFGFCAVKMGDGADEIREHLHDALLYKHDISSLKALRDSGEWTDMDMVVDTDGNTWHYTALACAASMGSSEDTMRWLIAEGASVNETRECHYLPSIQAAASGFVEGLVLLKEGGCNLLQASSQGRTLAHGAAGNSCLPNHARTHKHQKVLQQLHDWDLPLDKEDEDGDTPADLADGRGHTQCAGLIRRLVGQRSILRDITSAVAENNFSLAHNLFRSDKGQEACSEINSAFAPVVKALEQHSEMMADSWVDEEGTGAGGQKKGKKKSGGGNGSKKKAVKNEPAIQLDDDTLIDTIDRRLKGTDDDWSSLSPAKLRALLIDARPGAAVSEKRIKVIKAAVLEHRVIQASIESGAVVGCCICMDGVADYVLVHGITGHQCVCKTCAERMIADSLPCNMCRQTIDYVQAAALVDRGQVTVYHDQQ
jgi:hypothetical protein